MLYCRTIFNNIEIKFSSGRFQTCHYIIKQCKIFSHLPLIFPSFILFLFLFIFLAVTQSEAAFRDGFLGARSMAMGGACTAIAEDVDGALVNPAGLSVIKSQQIMATMAVLYVGLSDDSTLTQNIVGYANKSGDIGSFGVVWKRFSAGNLYYENILALSYARSSSFYVTKGDKNRRKNLSFGGTIKLMNWDSAPTVDSNGRIIEDLPGWAGVSFDTGFVIWPSVNTSVAVAFQNLRRPDITSSLSKVTEKLPLITRMGVAAINRNTTWTMDMVLRQGEFNLKIGLERKARDGNLFLRTGISLENLAWGMNYTVGAGYRLSKSARIDYAFVYPINTILDTFGSHRISIVYDFGGEALEENVQNQTQ